MKICFIADQDGNLAAVQDELQDVINTFSGAGHTVHVADANRADIRAALLAGPFDLAWFAGHSSADGFVLSDGTWTPAEVGRWLLATRTWSFVANACFSVEHVLAIQRVADVDVVATISPAGVDDGEAASTALYLARALVETNDLQAATRRASANGQLQYRYFSVNGREQMREQMRDGYTSEDVAALVRALKGDPFTGTAGLISTVSTLANNVQTLTQTIEAYRRETDIRLSALESSNNRYISATPHAIVLTSVTTVTIMLLAFWLIVRFGMVY